MWLVHNKPHKNDLILIIVTLLTNCKRDNVKKNVSSWPIDLALEIAKE